MLSEATGYIHRLTADRGYDADRLRTDLREKGITPIIPGKRGLKRKIRHDQRRYHERWRGGTSFCRLKDFRRIATCHDKLARNLCLSHRAGCRHRPMVPLESARQKTNGRPIYNAWRHGSCRIRI